MKPRTSRLRRAWNIWLVLPEVIRLTLILIAAFAAAVVAGFFTP